MSYHDCPHCDGEIELSLQGSYEYDTGAGPELVIVDKPCDCEVTDAEWDAIYLDATDPFR